MMRQADLSACLFFFRNEQPCRDTKPFHPSQSLFFRPDLPQHQCNAGQQEQVRVCPF